MCYIFHQRLNFYSLYIFLCQNAYNTNFLPIFLIFDHIWQDFWAIPTFFLNIFFWWSSFINQDIKFISTLVIFCDKLNKITIFYIFFSFFANFDQFRYNFVASLRFFSNFFSTVYNLICVIYSTKDSIFIRYVFFCVKMRIIPIFYKFFSFLTTFNKIFFFNDHHLSLKISNL